MTPKVTLKVTLKVTFGPKNVTLESLFGSKSHFWRYFQGYVGWDPDSHFLVAFEPLSIFRGFGGSRRSAASQHKALYAKNIRSGQKA